MAFSATDKSSDAADDAVVIDLRNPLIAGLLAWLLPGAGHIYQRRYGKGVLFMVCILAAYLFGFLIGGGHVVYASWAKNDRRWQYICQVGVGLPALPAVLQNRLARNPNREPLFGGLMAPPSDVNPKRMDELAIWHARLGSRFELGTLYTMVAGLLNIVVIFDACSGPFVSHHTATADRGRREEDEEDDKHEEGEEDEEDQGVLAEE